MKKLILAVAALAALATGAEAGKRAEKPLGWASPNSSGTHFYTKPIASMEVDTTAVFSLEGASIDGGRTGGKVANFVSQDSVLVGYIVAFTDSSADGASTLTAITASIDASGDGNDWAAVGTAAGVAASDDPIVVIPLYYRPGLSQQSLLVHAPKLRVRFTTVTGILLSARTKLVWWPDEDIN